MNDLVSIIMPSYNTASYIADSVKSVLDQTYKNWELIIVDDCSSDDTLSVVSRFTDERIKFFRNENNSGAALTRNRALREAKGKWIAFLDSDDLWHPEKLEKQIGFMEKNGFHFSYTAYTEIDENGADRSVTVRGPKRITKTGMKNYCWPGCLTVMYDADVVGLIQLKGIKKNNDYAMWLQASKKADCYFLDEFLAKYRRGRSGSISTHGYIDLVKWHYRLFREEEECGVVVSIFNTCRNIGFGLLKKLLYVR